MRAWRVFPLVVLLLGLVSASCAHLYDRVTVDHLELIRSNRSLPADSCTSFVAYEQAKQQAKSPMFDSKSLRNVRKACDCVARAGADTGLVRTS